MLPELVQRISLFQLLHRIDLDLRLLLNLSPEACQAGYDECIIQSDLILKVAHMLPEQKRIYKSMTPDEKFAVANSLYWTARRAREAWLRSLHPEWTEERVSRTVKEIFLRART